VLNGNYLAEFAFDLRPAQMIVANQPCSGNGHADDDGKLDGPSTLHDDGIMRAALT
jgi:hypothetical protein